MQATKQVPNSQLNMYEVRYLNRDSNSEETQATKYTPTVSSKYSRFYHALHGIQIQCSYADDRKCRGAQTREVRLN
jgi:hypothetical protein